MESSSGGEGNNAKSALPFLVTQWLSEFSSNTNDTGSNRDEDTSQKEEILMRIRSATSELAAAFTDLGAFGVTLSVSKIFSFAFCHFTHHGLRILSRRQLEKVKLMTLKKFKKYH